MTAFAAQEQAMGAAIMMAFPNARLVPAGGMAMACIFSRPAADVQMGSAGMAARGALATCSTAELGAEVRRGSQVRVYWDDQLFQPAGQYAVRDRDDDIEPGMTRLDLELATA